MSQSSLMKMGTQSMKSLAGSDSNEDEFYDAQDYFDPKILEMINLTKEPTQQLTTEATPKKIAVQIYLLQF